MRLACVVEHLWWAGDPGAPEPTAISNDAVLAAAGLAEGYFLLMAERVCGDAAIPAAERAAMALVRYLRANGLASFNARDMRREIGGLVREASAMDAACAVLVEAGLIRESDKRVDPEMDDERRIYYQLTGAGRAALEAELKRYREVVAVAKGRLAHGR